MIAIATGRKDLDEAIKVELADGYIVNYKEFLITNDENYQFETVILSRHLKGTTMGMEELLFCLKQEDIRIIYLTNEDEYEEIRMCLKLNIYDIILDPIATEKVKYVFDNPMKFPDISKLYVKIMNDEDIEGDKKVSLKNLIKNKLENENGEQSEDNSSNNAKVKEKIKIIEKETIQYKLPSDYKKMLLFLSPLSTGKTEIACSLAKCLSSKGKKVALIDLDLYKFGVFYNFNIGGQLETEEQLEEIFKYRNLFKKFRNTVMRSEQIKEFSHHIDNLDVYTSQRDIPIDATITEIIDMIKRMRPLYDITIIDLSSRYEQELMEQLIRFEFVEKYIVVEQNIETLNTIPYKLKFEYDEDYENFNLIINKYSDVKIDEKEVIKYLCQKDDEDLKFKFKKVFKIPNSWDTILAQKLIRATTYEGNNKEFNASINNLAMSLEILSERENKKNLFKNLFNKEWKKTNEN